MLKHLILVIVLFANGILHAQNTAAYKFAVLKYNGGGDWYSNPSSVPNLVAFCNKNLGMNIHKEVATVEAGSPDIFNYPFVHMTGHGNVVFSSRDVENLRAYLLGGGFLHISDNYGMNPFIRNEITKLFPDSKLVALPPTHPIFHQKYDFPKGLPKIHEHDKLPAQAFALFVGPRMLIFYDFECDLGDGWEDAGVHGDSEETRLKALQMGANIVKFALMSNG